MHNKIVDTNTLFLHFLLDKKDWKWYYMSERKYTKKVSSLINVRMLAFKSNSNVGKFELDTQYTFILNKLRSTSYERYSNYRYA